MNVKKKGNRGENQFANWLKENGVKAFRDSASGGALAKGDVHNPLDYTMEVKTVKKLSLMEAWKQVAKDASMARNRPLLAIHYDGMPKDEWLIVLHSNDWIDLELEGGTEHAVYEDPKKKYRLKRLIDEAKGVLKDFDI